MRGEREPIVGDGEAGEEEAAEEDLFKERGKQDAEGGDEPDVGWGVEEVVHGDGLGHGDEGAGGLHDVGERDADGDEAQGVADSGGGVDLEPLCEWPPP